MPSTEGLTDGNAAIPLYQQVIDIIKMTSILVPIRRALGYRMNSNWPKATKLVALPFGGPLRSSCSRAT